MVLIVSRFTSCLPVGWSFCGYLCLTSLAALYFSEFVFGDTVLFDLMLFLLYSLVPDLFELILIGDYWLSPF